MKYQIAHHTKYSYREPVFLEPHSLRFRPRTTPHCQVLTFRLEVSPAPAGRWTQLDEENNLVDFCWFKGMHHELGVAAQTIIEVDEYNPFSFFIYPKAYTTLPEFNVNANLTKGVEGEGLEMPTGLIAYGKDILANAKHDTLTYLTSLTQGIHRDFKLETREEGETWAPDRTWKERRGSCRDFTWLEIYLLRAVGLQARFVSGYYYIVVEKPRAELHAWVEVFLPGAGWIGVDPSYGIFTGAHHFSVAMKAHYRDTNPVSGSVRGDGVGNMTTSLTITQV